MSRRVRTDTRMNTKAKNTKKKIKKTRLGRGLEALLGEAAVSSSLDSPAGEQHSQLRQLPIEQLQRGKYQPRIKMEQSALQELAETIRTQGVIQPLLVREIERNRYEIIAGERRWRAAQLAGLAQVPVIIKQISDRNAMVMALVENLQREDLNVVEEAAGFRRLLDEFGLTHQQVADVVGRSRAAITNSLRLLMLPAAVKKLIADGKMEMGHARTLLGLPAQSQASAAAKVVAEQLSVRQTELLVKHLLAGERDHSATTEKGTEKDTDVLQLESKISAQLGARVSIQHRAKKGKMVIYYHSLEELDGILARIH